MQIAKLFRAAATVAAITMMPHLVAAEPPDTQGLIREREQQKEKLQQENKRRTQQELMQREQAERAARQRLESGRIERLQAPSILLPGAPPNLNSGVMQPGVTDRAGEMRRDDAARRDQREYDDAVRARQGIEGTGTGSTIGLPGPWKPIGAR